MLVVFAGLPGVGKTTLSRAVAQQVGATWLRVDAIESAIWRAGVDDSQPTGYAAYAVAYALADAHLDLQARVVIDAVNAVEPARAAWRELAGRHAVTMHVVEVVCADRELHRRRVEQRVPEHHQSVNPTWAEVLEREYEPWRDQRLIVDSGGDTAAAVTRILAHIQP